MKCDELQYERLGDANKTYPASTLVIRKQFVDAAIAELKAELSDARDDARSSRNLVDDKNEEIKELEDKVQQKDFFWDGCGFSKMGFKNTIDVANYVDSLKAENESLRKAVSNWHDKYCNLQETIDHLECKLECVKADKDKELRATKRAMWLARAWGANQRTKYLDLFLTGRAHAIRKYKWIKITSKCRAKAERFK